MEYFEIKMFLTTVYLHLNSVLMLNWIVWNGTIFDIESVLSLNWIVWYLTVCKQNLYLYKAELELFD